MGYQSGFYNPYTQARPQPANWQQAQEQGARDVWNQSGANTEANRVQAGARRTTAGATADAAYDSSRNFSPSATAGWAPSETATFNPQQYYSWMGSQPDANATVSSRLAGYSPTALNAFSSSDVSGFDPSAFGKTYAEGAFGTFKNKLGDELENLTNKSGARLRTGLFDRDRGKVITRASSDFSNALAGAATQFSGQRLQALESGAGMRLQRAQGIDENTRLAAGGADQTALDSARVGQAGQQMRLTASGDQARLALERAQGIDEGTYRQAHDTDTFGSNTRQSALDAALARERLASGENEAGMDRSAEFASSNREWAASDREAQDARDLASRLYNPYASPRTLGGTPYQAPDAAARRLADAYGVKYVG